MKYERVDIVEAAAPSALRPWEARAVDAVGSVIEFWNFKRNHGRIWALLYLRDVALTAAELQDLLGLSKGAVSMLLRELEQWGVIVRARSSSSGADVQRYVAETDLMGMLGRVLGARESGLVDSVTSDLEAAERAARSDGAAADTLDRLRRMRALSSLIGKALRLFLTTSRLDMAAARELLPFRSKRVRAGTAR